MHPQHVSVSARLWMSVAICAAAIAATSCASTSTPSGHESSASQPAPSSPAQSASATPTTSASPVSCPGGWQTGPATVAHQVAVPPVPVVTAIRTGSHPECKFDRVVLDISGATPGYSVSFVTKVIQDASGKTVVMPGTRYLVIRLHPAQGHQANGTLTLPHGVQTLSYQQLKGYAVAGDFEGVLTVALGLAGDTHYRIGELPGKIYIDVAW